MDICQKMDVDLLTQQSIISIYEDVLTGTRKTLPRGTWNNDQYVVLIIRYALEIKSNLSIEEISKITRQTIKEMRLWGALNRFKSTKRLLQFVYPDTFDEFDSHRVPTNYWSDINNIKKRFEYLLQKNNINFMDIPQFVTYNQLIEWGFANPLKRHDDSPFQLINGLYPNKFKPYQFKKSPQRYSKNR